MNRAPARASIRWEAVLISVLGTLVGLALGAGAQPGDVKALEPARASPTFRVPVGSLVVIAVAGRAASACSPPIRPARRAARLADPRRHRQRVAWHERLFV